MEKLDLIFSYYDKLIANISPTGQALVSLALLLILLWQIYQIIKSGHWIFIATLIILLPGTWPAAKQIGKLIIVIIEFLITRIQLAI